MPKKRIQDQPVELAEDGFPIAAGTARDLPVPFVSGLDVHTVYLDGEPQVNVVGYDREKNCLWRITSPLYDLKSPSNKIERFEGKVTLE